MTSLNEQHLWWIKAAGDALLLEKWLKRSKLLFYCWLIRQLLACCFSSVFRDKADKELHYNTLCLLRYVCFLTHCPLAVPPQSTCGRPSRWTPWSIWRPLRWWRLDWRTGSVSARPTSWWSPASTPPPGGDIRSADEKHQSWEPWRESELSNSENLKHTVKWG